MTKFFCAIEQSTLKIGLYELDGGSSSDGLHSNPKGFDPVAIDPFEELAFRSKAEDLFIMVANGENGIAPPGLSRFLVVS
jgi:hypothetical protein